MSHIYVRASLPPSKVARKFVVSHTTNGYVRVAVRKKGGSHPYKFVRLFDDLSAAAEFLGVPPAQFGVKTPEPTFDLQELQTVAAATPEPTLDLQEPQTVAALSESAPETRVREG